MMESLVQGKLARRVRWGGCRNVRSERNEARCVLTQSIRQRLASLTHKCRHAARRLAALESGMWLHLQSLLASPPLEPTGYQGPTGGWRSAAHRSSGQWVDRSYLERPGTLELSRRSFAVGGTKTTRTPQEVGSTRSKRPNTARCTTTSSTFASSSERGFMLNHQLMESYHLQRTDGISYIAFSYAAKGGNP